MDDVSALAVGARSRVERATEKCHPLAQAKQAVATRAGDRARGLAWNASAVILNPQLERSGRVAKDDRSPSAARMVDDVRECLLHDPVGAEVDCLGQRPRRPADIEIATDGLSRGSVSGNGPGTPWAPAGGADATAELTDPR